MTQSPSEFRPYVKKSTSVVLMRPYVPGEDLTNISVQPGYEPKYGDWIARNDSDPNDQWLVSEEYFKENYVPVR